jgi:hypothetical protein
VKRRGLQCNPHLTHKTLQDLEIAEATPNPQPHPDAAEAGTRFHPLSPQEASNLEEQLQQQSVLRSPPSHTIDDERTAATNLRPVEGGEASTAIEDEAADDGGTTLLQPPLTPSSAPKNPTPGREWEAPPPEMTPKKTKRPQRHRRPNFHHRWQSWRLH